MALVLYRESGKAADQGLSTRTFHLDHGVSVQLRQTKQDDGGTLDNVGLVVWQGAYVLVEHLLRTLPKEHWRGKRVVELGAGTGLVGIALAKLGAQVALTDLDHILPLLQENANLNPNEDYTPSVAALPWGDDAAVHRLGETDIVIGAELVYQEECFPALLSTLRALLSPLPAPMTTPTPTPLTTTMTKTTTTTTARRSKTAEATGRRSPPEAFFSFCLRGRGELKFEQMLNQEDFVSERVPVAELHGEYQAGNYIVLRIQQKQ